MLGAIGIIPALLSLGYLAIQLIEAWILRNSPAEVYRFRALSLADIRATVTLPTLSAAIGITAGAGVNLATGGGRGDIATAGIFLAGFSFVIIVVIGLALAAGHRPETSGRKFERRLARVSAGIADPFAPIESVLALKPEVVRNVKLGARLIQSERTVTYRGWLKRVTVDTELRVGIGAACFFLTIMIVAG